MSAFASAHTLSPFSMPPLDDPASTPPALRTPFVLPEVPPRPEPPSDAENIPADGEEDVHPAGQYHLAPNASMAGQLAEAIEERLLNGNAPDLASLPPGTRLPLALQHVLDSTPPNLYLHLSGIDEAVNDVACGFEEQGRLEGRGLPSSPALVAWISCETAWWLDLYDLRMEVEPTAGVEAAHATIQAVTGAFDPIMPVWDPPCAYEYIREMHWFGFCDDSERIADIKRDLAHSRDCDPEDISDEEAREVGADYIWSTPFVHEVLKEPYRNRRSARLTPDELRRRLQEHGLTDALQIVQQARQVREQVKIFQNHWGYSHGQASYSMHRRTPWSLIVTVGPDGMDSPGSGLVVETFEEEARHNYESGFAEAPMEGLVFDPTCAPGRERFFSFLREMLDCVGACRRLAERVSPGCYDDEDERAGRSARLDEHRERAEQSAPLPATFRSGHQQVREDVRQAGSVLSALPLREESAERTLPSGAVPVFL